MVYQKVMKILELNGGFRVKLKRRYFKLTNWFSHDVNFKIPKEIKISVEKQTVIKINEADKELVSKLQQILKI